MKFWHNSDDVGSCMCDNCLYPNGFEKRKIPWLSLAFGLIILGMILYSAIWGGFDPSSYPGEFGY